MFHSLTAYAEFVSLVLTVPTVMLGCLVLRHYGPRAMCAARKAIRREGPLTEIDYLVVGIVVGFSGAVLDNVYWAFAWTSALLQLPSMEFFFSMGAWPNIPSRQGAGTIAAILHLLPVMAMPEDSRYYALAVSLATISSGCILLLMMLYG